MEDKEKESDQEELEYLEAEAAIEKSVKSKELPSPIKTSTVERSKSRSISPEVKSPLVSNTVPTSEQKISLHSEKISAASSLKTSPTKLTQEPIDESERNQVSQVLTKPSGPTKISVVSGPPVTAASSLKTSPTKLTQEPIDESEKNQVSQVLTKPSGPTKISVVSGPPVTAASSLKTSLTKLTEEPIDESERSHVSQVLTKPSGPTKISVVSVPPVTAASSLKTSLTKLTQEPIDESERNQVSQVLTKPSGPTKTSMVSVPAVTAVSNVSPTGFLNSATLPGAGTFPCANGLLQKRSPFIHNPPQPEERRARIQCPRTTREYIINLREDLADFQESHGLPRSRDYSFLSLGLALAQETGRAIYSVFLMLSELFPILAIVSLILRFALDKVIEILETNETIPKVKKTIIFAFEMLAIMIPLWILVGTVIIPLITLILSIFKKMLRIKGGRKKAVSKSKTKVNACGFL